MMRFAEVAVDAPAGYDRTFSYSIPGHMDVQPGHLVEVPFGPRTLQGVVFSLPPVPQVSKTREIQSTLAPEPYLSETQLSLARWISQHYMSALFEAAALMLPPGSWARTKTHLSLGPRSDTIEPRPSRPVERRVLEYIRPRGLVDQDRLIQAMGPGARAAVGRLVDAGVLHRSSRRARPPVGPKYRHFATLTAAGRAAVGEWILGAARRAPRQAELVTRLLEDSTPLPLSEARKLHGASAVNGLLAKGWIEDERLRLERDPLAGRVFPPSKPVVLTPTQREVVSEIRAALEDDSAVPRSFLIQGVTGSGKTEVYLDSVKRCLELGKRAVVLVPEIALTHQTVEWFAARFQGEVAVLHSGLSAGERFDQWWKIRQADYGVVIGSRSAIFSPQPDLGLIVLDEEHEWTYKQHDASPRYHAREVALKLAELTGATVVMGSASPDVASYYKSLRNQFRMLKLPERVSADGSGGESTRGVTALSAVEVVDMRRELREGNREVFSRALVSAMVRCLEGGGQMILFLNRRGSASYVQCRNCGASVRCRRCDVALTYHRAADRLICHYCDYRRIAPAKCHKCMSYRMSYYGVGTQKVAEEVSRLFPEAEVLRWDRDATRTPKQYQEFLDRFRSGDAQVLVGTQMIAKGLHFPSVTLVGVVSADVGLNIPDYRAGERAFQLLCQVAGRAGRGEMAGTVIIQTYQPDNYAVQAAAAQDYERFYRQEIEFRAEQANPPFSKLIRLIHSNTNRAACEREAVRFARSLRRHRDSWGHSDIELLGPTPAYPARLRGHYRWHLIMRGPQPRVLLDRVAIPQGWVVDIDPVMLT